MKKVYAFIPARIGSKRIKRKNLMNFKGKPLINWTIEAAIKSKIFNKIYVSADHIDIYNKIKNNKKIVKLYRPKYLSKSNSKIETLLMYYIKKKIIYNKNVTLVLLQPTSPLRNYKIIKTIVNFFFKKRLSSLITVSKLVNNFIIRKNHKIINRKIKFSKIYLNGAMYINNIDNFLKYKKFNNNESFYYLMEKKFSLDIDTHGDIKTFFN